MKKSKSKILALLTMGVALLSGCSAIDSFSASNEPKIQKQDKSKIGGLSSKDYQKLSQLNYRKGDPMVKQVNHGRSTLNFKWKSDRIIYQNLDKLNRTSGSTTAYLDKRNLANQSKRTRQTVKPTGWHYPYRNGKQIYNRGHLIAYSLSGGINSAGKYTGRAVGDQNNPKNLFTQTAYSNQNLQTEYEDQVREAIRSGQKVIYQATPIFRGDELMARGINLQAKSQSDMLNFNVYLFNVQPNYEFNYRNGNIKNRS